MTDPSPPSPLLDRLLTEVLAQLELVSHVKAALIGRETARLKPSGSTPRGPAQGPERGYREKYDQCVSNAARLRVIRDAQEELRQLRYSPDRSKWRGTLEWKVAIATDPRASSAVARVYAVSPSYVRKLRKEFRGVTL